MSTPLLVFQGVSMQYGAPGAAKRQVLDEVSFALPPSTSISLVGPSGSGKSTLLHLAAGILVPSEGTISLSGQNLTDLSETRRTHLRRTHLGLVFQFFHLLPHLTVGENISLPAIPARWKSAWIICFSVLAWPIAAMIQWANSVVEKCSASLFAAPCC